MRHLKSDSNSSRIRLWTGDFVALLSANLLLCFGFYMLPVTLPAYVQQLGGTHLQASLAIGLFSATSLLSRVLAAAVIDAVGERLIIPAGIIVIGATTLSFIWLPIDGILFLRALQGIGWGMATAAIATVVYKIVPAGRRGEGSGYYALTVIIAVSVTPLLAIVLLNAFQFAILLSVAAALTLAALALQGRGLTALPRTNAASQSIPRVTIKSIFEPGALLPAGLCALLSISLCGIVAYLVLFAAERRLAHVWVYFIGYALMILLTRPFIGRLFDRSGHRYIILPGSVSMILGLVALAQTQSTGMLIVSSLLYGFGYGAVQPTLQTWAVNRCPVDRKAAANGLFLSGIDLGYMVGAITLGQIARFTSYATMYLCAALTMLVFVAIYVREVRRESQR